ncbi:MAG: hypothetical protein V4690_01970 [Patescibacteria group bacterium]
MLPEFLTIKTIYTILHVFGAILGAGAAFVGDNMFFKTVKDGVIEKTELEFMQMNSRIVWIGVGVLLVSGILLFMTDPARYMDSSKFLAKITIVLVIVLNGFAFHIIHIPNLKKHIGMKFAESEVFRNKSTFLLASGAVSVTSWIFTVVLGMLRAVPYTYFEILGVYLFAILFAVFTSYLLKNKILGFR